MTTVKETFTWKAPSFDSWNPEFQKVPWLNAPGIDYLLLKNTP